MIALGVFGACAVAGALLLRHYGRLLEAHGAAPPRTSTADEAPGGPSQLPRLRRKPPARPGDRRRVLREPSSRD